VKYKIEWREKKRIALQITAVQKSYNHKQKMDANTKVFTYRKKLSNLCGESKPISYRKCGKLGRF